MLMGGGFSRGRDKSSFSAACVAITKLTTGYLNGFQMLDDHRHATPTSSAYTFLVISTQRISGL